MCPRSGFRSGGTCERSLVPVFVPGEHPNVPSFRFCSGAHQPKPPFWKTTLLRTPDLAIVCSSCLRFSGSHQILIFSAGRCSWYSFPTNSIFLKGAPGTLSLRAKGTLISEPRNASDSCESGDLRESEIQVIRANRPDAL